MTVMTSPSEAALLGQLVSQIEQNVQFLVANNYMSSADASPFLNKLERVNVNGAANNIPAGRANPVLPAPRSAPPMPTSAAPPIVRARALWGYNEDGSDADDLSFSVGDIIEIVEETNADWWTGRFNGRQALFPANYVQKIEESSAAPSPGPRTLPPAYTGSTGGAKSTYKPFMAAHASANAPPPPGGGTNAVGLQQDPGQEQKKGKFGKYGNTMAHSAAGGVGFGAGAAIGGGLVRAIF